MNINKEKLIVAYNELNDALTSYVLPKWCELPDIELYMDQVISLLTKYLGIFCEMSGSDKLITPAMINNYVKLGTMPAPVKKKYSKKHLAYLLIICTLKQTLDMSTIQKLIPVGIDDNEVERIYNSFVHNQHKAFNYVIENVKVVADPILLSEDDNADRVNDILMQVSASANIFKILIEQMTKF